MTFDSICNWLRGFLGLSTPDELYFELDDIEFLSHDIGESVDVAQICESIGTYVYDGTSPQLQVVDFDFGVPLSKLRRFGGNKNDLLEILQPLLVRGLTDERSDHELDDILARKELRWAYTTDKGRKTRTALLFFAHVPRDERGSTMYGWVFHNTGTDVIITGEWPW